jgi:GAF domain-containing protein
MRPRATTLVSWPAPPALGSLSVAPPPIPITESGVFERVRPELIDDEEDEVVLALSRRREVPPESQVRPRASIESAAQAASIAAASLAASLDARAVLIHTHDPESGELRVIGAWGEQACGLIDSVESSDDDFVASAVVANGRPLKMLLAGGLPRVAPLRLEVLEAARSLIAAPIMVDGSCVGLIEIIDIDESLSARAAKACVAVGASLARSL